MTALKSVRKVDEEASYEILPGVSLIKDGVQTLRRGKELKVEDLPTDSRLRSVKLAEMLVEASTNFISGRSLKISLPKMGPVAVSRALEEGCFCCIVSCIGLIGSFRASQSEENDASPLRNGRENDHSNVGYL